MRNVIFLSSIAILFFFLMACNEDIEPSLYNPNYQSGPQPVISAIDPPGSALAGVGTIKVSGQHFKPVEPYNDYNQIYFDKRRVNIISMTEAELIISSPNYINDSIVVKIAVRGSDLFSEPFFYRLTAAVDTTFGGLDDLPQKHILYGLAFDLTNNLYLSAQVAATPNFGRIFKIDEMGGRLLYADKTTFLRANGMRMGPENKLYVAIVAGRVKQIKTIDNSGTETVFANLPTNPRDLEFDNYGNLWVAAQENLIRIKSDQSAETVYNLGIDLKSVRVYDEYLYTVGSKQNLTEQKILRFKINSDGSLGSEEIVLDAEGEAWLAGKTINAITFSADGVMYLGTTASPDALFEFDPESKSHQVIYPGLIAADIYALHWDSGNFLFATQQQKNGESNILKIDMRKQGAPYFGRQ